MKFKEKFLFGVMFSSFAILTVAQPIQFVCCFGDNMATFYQVSSCSEISNYTPSNACTVQLCDANSQHCIGVGIAATATINPYVATQPESKPASVE